MTRPEPKPGGINKPCQYQGHTICAGTYVRPVYGVLPSVRYAHHPRPDHNQHLHLEEVRCICECHARRAIPAPQPDTTD